MRNGQQVEEVLALIQQPRVVLLALALGVVLLAGCSTSPDTRPCKTSGDCVAKSGDVQYLCYREFDSKCHPKKFLDEGLACGLDDHCMSGTTCVGPAGQRKCIRPRSEGEACASSEECSGGMSCYNAKCFRLRSDGENCASPNECRSGLLCYSKDKACHRANVAGLHEPCASDEECQSSLICFAGDKTCHAQKFLNVGQPCTRTIECRAGSCEDGACQDPSCNDSNDCTGGHLCYDSDRRCHPPHYLENGRPCISDMACRSGSCNLGSCSGRR